MKACSHRVKDDPVAERARESASEAQGPVGFAGHLSIGISRSRNPTDRRSTDSRGAAEAFAAAFSGGPFSFSRRSGSEGTRWTMIVLDASAVLEVLLRTAQGRTIEERIFHPDESMHAPHLLDLKVLSGRFALGDSVGLTEGVRPRERGVRGPGRRSIATKEAPFAPSVAHGG